MLPIINITVATKKKQKTVVSQHVTRKLKSCCQKIGQQKKSTSFNRHVQRVVLKHVFGVNTRPLPDIRLEQQFDCLCAQRIVV